MIEQNATVRMGEPDAERSNVGTAGSVPAVPDGIESTEGKLVYLYLATAGDSEVGELVDRLDVPRITAYSVLGTLERRGIVERIGVDAYRAG